MRILYAEDNQANIYFMRRLARVGHHEVINFIEGASVLRKFDQINPDLVLIDVQLSGTMNGLEVVRKLRQRGVETPIIAVTAYATPDAEARCLAAGCNDYLAKPLPHERLIELFRKYDPARRKADGTIDEAVMGKDTENVARVIVKSAVANAKRLLADRAVDTPAPTDALTDAAAGEVSDGPSDEPAS